MAWAPKLVTGTSGSLTTSVTAYSTGDQLGGEITLTSMATGNAGYGVITGITVLDEADVMGGFDIFLWQDTTTPASDNAAAAWSDADARKIVPGFPISMPAPVDVGGARLSPVQNLWIPFQTGSSHANLYCDLVTRSNNSFFAAATDLKVYVSLLQYS